MSLTVDVTLKPNSVTQAEVFVWSLLLQDPGKRRTSFCICAPTQSPK
jgi:hypothetical protein